jgi:hypothetical protein
MPWELVSASDNRFAQAGPLHLLTDLEPSQQRRSPLARQPTLQDVCLSFKPDEQNNERRGSWHIQARKERKEEETYRHEKLKWYRNARIALLTDNTSEMLLFSSPTCLHSSLSTVATNVIQTIAFTSLKN